METPMPLTDERIGSIPPLPPRREEPRELRMEERRKSARDHRDEVLRALLEISNYVGSVMSLDDILERIVAITSRVMGAQSCSIYLWNEDRSSVVMRCNTGLEKEIVGKASFARGHGIPGIVAVEGSIIALSDAHEDSRYAPIPSSRVQDFHAYLCAPLRIQDDIIGVLALRMKAIHKFTADEITTCETICKQVAIVVEKARLYTARIEAEKLAAVAVSLSGVAHYIKNMLLVMRGGEFGIEEGLKARNLDQISSGWGLLKRSSSKIRDLVENMLNYYRDTELHPRPVDLNAFILDNLHRLEDRAMERQTLLTPDLDLRLDKVEIDPDAFQDVMINLITNAIDAIPERWDPLESTCRHASLSIL